MKWSTPTTVDLSKRTTWSLPSEVDTQESDTSVIWSAPALLEDAPPPDSASFWWAKTQSGDWVPLKTHAF